MLRVHKLIDSIARGEVLVGYDVSPTLVRPCLVGLAERGIISKDYLVKVEGCK